ncbi:hypothetical protein E1283_32560 [Streptomyces hainanensis]|uniref:LPXTG cell wall anchor domain-containing protein n=1 Tax=Streptomyces hainanensis TaxID=402648 RepID=A0A4R4SLE2_9ACTN|nr:hypothetical protein E1283_32560 [Streptomyces hainanensis]
MTLHPTRRIRRPAALAACAAALLWAAAGPAPTAAAHPFGPPSTATISTDGPLATLTWHAAEDDWVALGEAVGAFEDPALDAVSTELTGEQKLQRSPELRAYLLDRIHVAQGGARCAGEVASLDDLLTDGAVLEYRCPRDIEEVDVTVGALSDLNEAYRTMLTAESGGSPGQTLLTATDTTQRVAFARHPGGALGNPAALGVAGCALAIVAGAVGYAAVVRRRRVAAA